MTDMFDWAAALAEREAGMKIAADHAEEDHKGWKHEALEMVRRYSGICREFVSEDCTEWVLANGLRKPDEPRAMGQIYRMAEKAGITEKAGTGRSKKRASPTTLWRSCHPNFKRSAT